MSLWAGLKARGRNEGGIVIVYVLAVLAIAMALGVAALADTLSSGQLTTHDQRTRRAQQAAEAGIQAALYAQTEGNLSGAYNFTGGQLGISQFLDCSVRQFNRSLQVVGVSAYASSGGVCPQAIGSGGPISGWTAVGNHAYYDSEFLSNKEETGGTGTGSAVEFPEIVSLGCDATVAGGCPAGASSDVYSRELAIFAPTGPLQSIEGMGTVTINGLGALGLGAVAVDGDVSAGGTLALPTAVGALSGNFTLNSVPQTNVEATFAAPSFTGEKIGTASNVTTSGFCTATSPSTSCTIKRQPISITTTTCALCGTGITCASCTGGGYSSSNDTFTLTGGTATFPAGDYVFCNFNATGGTVNADASSTTPVRIFILPPNVAPCNGYAYTASQKTNGTVGNFTASQGIDNTATGTVNNVGGTVDPSGLQIYVQGDGSYDNSTSVTVGDPATCTSHSLLGICLGGALNQVTESMVIYAPTSSVDVNEGTCLATIGTSCALGLAGAFEGTIVGDNTQVTAGEITQDFDLGNYPLYSGNSLLQPVEDVQCDGSKTSLGGTAADTSGC